MIEILKTLIENRKKLFFTPIFFGVLGLAFSYLIPVTYKANVKILPPQQSQSTASAIMSQLGGLAGGASSALGLRNPNDMYVAMLKSRSIADELIKRFDLKNHYELEFQDQIRKRLETRSSISAGKDSLISIDVEDTNPKIAAALANAYVEELTSVTGRLAITDASQRRIFYEKQLKTIKDQLASLEHSLAKNLDANGILSIDTQSKAILETSARLRASISAKEIQLKSMQANLTPSNSLIKRVSQELVAMQSELSKLENGKKDVLNSESSTSELNNQNIQKLRDIKHNQMLYDILVKQYEIARLDEAKEAPIIQILDQAIEPERKNKPQRLLIALTASFIGFLLILFFIFSSEKIKSIRNLLSTV